MLLSGEGCALFWRPDVFCRDNEKSWFRSWGGHWRFVICHRSFVICSLCLVLSLTISYTHHLTYPSSHILTISYTHHLIYSPSHILTISYTHHLIYVSHHAADGRHTNK